MTTKPLSIIFANMSEITLSEMASALGKLAKGCKKTMSDAAIKQRSLAGSAPKKKRIKPVVANATL